MLRFIVLLFLNFISLFFSIVKAQNLEKIPCDNASYHQFDFWIGDWEVFDTNGKLIGVNLVKSLHDACAIQENWMSLNGESSGTSFSYYDASDKKWHQLWIDNKGFVLKTSGYLVDNEMILQSSLVQEQNTAYSNKIIWKKNNEDTVTQTWQRVDNNNKLIKEVFKGIYKRKKH